MPSTCSVVNLGSQGTISVRGDGDQTPSLLPGRGDTEMGSAVLKPYMSAVCLGGSLEPGGGGELRAQPPELLAGRTGDGRLKGDLELSL